MRLMFRHVAVATAFLGWAAPVLAQAPAWPVRAVKVITPQPPGSGIDLSCRIFADKLAQKWGQPVVIENRPGADGVTGVAAFASAGDDHTLLCSFGAPITISPFTAQSKLPYDPTADLKPIAVVADFVQVFAVSNTTGLQTIEALRKKAATEPGKMNWSATQGLPFMLFGSFLRSHKLEMAYVPYTALGSALQDLAQGRIEAYATSYASLVPVLESGQAKILMVLNGTRAPQAPDVPTAKELGMPELTVVSFCGFFGPKDMPEAVRERIAAELRVIGSDPDLMPRLQKMGSFVRTSTPAEFAQMIEDQRKTVEAILKATGGLKP